MKAPRIVIAGASSNSGKTLVCMGLARALVNRGLSVACFKTGPDYIDSAYLSKASGSPCGNIDTWLMDSDYIISSICSASKDADIVIIEGVRSLYDGATPIGDEGSTAHIAKLLDAPVLLTINARSLAKGAAAVAKGFCALDPDVWVAGVLLNMIKGPTHYLKATIALRSLAGMEVYGSLIRTPSISTAMRHLGLVTVEENPDCEAMITAAAALVEESCDIDRIVELARQAPELDEARYDKDTDASTPCEIAVAQDAAFNFMYPQTIASLRDHGAAIRYVSPLSNIAIPETVSALILAGGYPECHAHALSRNSRFMKDIVSKADDGMPVYAECGGLLYLSRSLTDIEGRSYGMCGFFDADSFMHPTCQSVSYTVASSIADSIVSSKGAVTRGHEFHYSSVIPCGSDHAYAYRMDRGKGIDGIHDGMMLHNVLAQYSHIHFGSCPLHAKKLTESAHDYIHR